MLHFTQQRKRKKKKADEQEIRGETKLGYISYKLDHYWVGGGVLRILSCGAVRYDFCKSAPQGSDLKYRSEQSKFYPTDCFPGYINGSGVRFKFSQ